MEGGLRGTGEERGAGEEGRIEMERDVYTHTYVNMTPENNTYHIVVWAMKLWGYRAMDCRARPTGLEDYRAMGLEGYRIMWQYGYRAIGLQG
eukprot:5513126-Pyramimonas_sp.AAC.2